MDNVDPPMIAADLPELEDKALQLWLRFLAQEVDCGLKKVVRLSPRVTRLEMRVWAIGIGLTVVGGFLFAHLGWK